MRFRKPKRATVSQRKMALAAMGMTQQDFAMLADTSHVTVNRWVNGLDVDERLERQIIAAVNKAGWLFARGGIIRDKTAAKIPVA